MTALGTSAESAAGSAPTNEVAAVRAGGRLAFLDVLRGIAALGVVFYHLGNQEGVLNERFYWASHTVLNLGGFGVMLFFLVSGFIIPASLERHGSITEFWISRVFRLGPLFWFLSLVVFGFASLGWITISEHVYGNWPVALFGNVTVLARHLGGSFLIGPAWTLPYEICFYGLTTILFATRLRRASAAVALAGGGVVLVATDQLIGPSAVTPWVSGVPGYQGNPLRVLGIALLVGAAAALLARSRASGLYAAVAALCFIPLLLNRPDPLYQAAIYLTLMFTGTVAHRIWAGQLRPQVGWVVFAACGLACAGGFWLHTTTWYGPFGQVGESAFTRSMMVASAFLLFTTFYLLRERVSWPAPLRWLGRVSYSLYLVHWVVMMSVPALPASVPGFRTLTVLMWLAITLAVSELTFRFVEDPAVKLGRTVTRRLRAVRARRARVAGPAQAPALALAARD